MAFVQAINAQGLGVTSVTTSAITTTAGNLLAAGCGEGTGQTVSISDSKSNSWTAHADNPVGDFHVAGWYAQNISGGGSHTFTFTPSASGYPSGVVFEYSGRATASALDVQSSGSTTAQTSHNGPDLTTTVAGCDLFAFNTNSSGSNQTQTAGTGWTKPTNGGNPDGVNGTASFGEHRDNVSTGTYSADFTTDDSVNMNIVAFAFKAAAAAGNVNLLVGKFGHPFAGKLG